MQEHLTLQDYGSAGNNQGQGTDVCVITAPPAGRYKVWGHCRHTLADGFRLLKGSTTIIEISSGANAAQNFGPVVIDLLTGNTDNLILELFTATGASDTASGTLYAQRINP